MRTKKIRELEKVLLEKISRGLQSDIDQLAQNKETSLSRLKRLNDLASSLKNPDEIEKGDFIRRGLQFAFDTYFTCNSAIFDEAISSGKMSYIRNDQLLEDIFAYYRRAKESLQDDTTRKITDEILTPLLKNIIVNKEGLTSLTPDQGMASALSEAIDLPSLDLKSLRKSEDFWFLSALKQGVNRVQIVRWEEMRAIATKLKQQIEEELKSL